ncbi:hypothetical protein BX600DRAFT_514488 [Xylariales sp. PMI_506]|nr:hypothetical protein BX600DRAFT_514488 [Xylariales sp. PMI_506]
MPGLCDLPHEIYVLIAACEHEPRPPPVTAPPQLPGGPPVRLPPPDSIILPKPILQPADLGALARTCRQLYDSILPLLYTFDRERQSSSAVTWAAKNGRNSTLKRAEEHGLTIKAVPNPRRMPYRRPRPPGHPPDPPRYNPPKFIHPVQLAVVDGRVDTVAWFLDHGLGVDEELCSMCRCVVAFAPLLHTAICADQKNVVQLLVERGASLDFKILIPFSSSRPPRLQSTYNTALHEAAWFNRHEIIQYLVSEVGVDIHALNPRGRSALMFAILNKKTENVATVEKLLELGARVLSGPSATWEHSAMRCAIEKGSFKVAEVLLESAAKSPDNSMPKPWYTKAMLWSILKTAPHIDVKYNDEDTDFGHSTLNPHRLAVRPLRLASRGNRETESDSSSNASITSTSSNSDSDDDTTTASSSSASSFINVRYRPSEEPWNVRRRTFMKKLLASGFVDLSNNGKPLLTFSIEAWVAQMLLDAGADPNDPRCSKQQGIEEYALGLSLKWNRLASWRAWTENAKCLLNAGARLDRPHGRLRISILLSAAKRGRWHLDERKLRFLLDHSTSQNVTQQHLDDVLANCFDYKLLAGCRVLTRYGAQATPSSETVYYMAKGLIQDMADDLADNIATTTTESSDNDSENSTQSHDSSPPPSIEEKSGVPGMLPYLSFLLGYALPPVLLALLFAQAVEGRAVRAAHMLLDHGAVLSDRETRELYSTHLLALAARLGELSLVRRLCIPLIPLLPRPFADRLVTLLVGILYDHPQLVLFILGSALQPQTAEAVEEEKERRRQLAEEGKATALGNVEYLPSEEVVLKGKSARTPKYWNRDLPRRTRLRARLEEPPTTTSLPSLIDTLLEHPDSVVQLTVNAGNLDMIRLVVKRLVRPKGKEMVASIYVPCVLAEAVEIKEFLLEKDITVV